MNNFFGFNLYKKTIYDCISDSMRNVLREKKAGYFACLNPHSFVVSKNDSIFFNALKSSTFLVADGIGISVAYWFLFGKKIFRITGPDFFYQLMLSLNRKNKGVRVFFLGSSVETLEKLTVRFANEFPDLILAGTYSPPFKNEFDSVDTKKMIDSVNASKADLLWVSMTAPKQEKWLYENISKLDIGFAGAVGAAFDFYVGSIPRSSVIYQRLGLEWLPRLIREPRRLWRRMFLSAPIFVADVIRMKWHNAIYKKGR